MPVLAFDTTLTLSESQQTAITDRVTSLYTEQMATTAGHVAVMLRQQPQHAIALGRAVDGPIVILQADIRRGRSFDRKRAFALAVMDYLQDTFGVPEPNLKVAFTEHAGEELMGQNRVGGEWDEPSTEQGE